MPQRGRPEAPCAARRFLARDAGSRRIATPALPEKVSRFTEQITARLRSSLDEHFRTSAQRLERNALESRGSAVRARSAPRSNLVERMSTGAPEKSIVTGAAVAARAITRWESTGRMTPRAGYESALCEPSGLGELGKNESPEG